MTTDEETKAGLGETRDGPSVAAAGDVVRLPPGLAAHLTLGRKLGEGAMALVYQGTDERTGEVRAVKVARPGAHPMVRRRMIDEGRLMMRIRHPNVVSVVEMHDDPAQPILVCEFVQGGTLQDLLDRHRHLPLSETTRFADGLLAGLQAIHEQGVVHRDLKPSNVLLAATGDVKISDLGVAKQWGDEGSGLTAVGQIIGTPHYMAPEQLRGEPAALYSDLYAVGVMLYEMLTGHLPHDGATLKALLESVEAGAIPPISQFNADVPAEISTLVARALSRRGADRPVSAEAFRMELSARARKMARDAAVDTGAPEVATGRSRTHPVRRPDGMSAAAMPPQSIAARAGLADRRLRPLAVLVVSTLVVVAGMALRSRSGSLPPARAATQETSITSARIDLAALHTEGKQPRSPTVTRHFKMGWLSPGPLIEISNPVTPEQLQTLAVRISKDPNDLDAVCTQALALLRRGTRADVRSAVTVLEQALKKHPNDAALCNDLAICLESLDQSKQAIAAFERAIQIAPQVGAPHGNLGYTHLRLQHDVTARPLFEAASRLDSLRADEYREQAAKNQSY